MAAKGAKAVEKQMFPAGPRPRTSTSAFDHKADIPADEIIDLGMAAIGQKQTVASSTKLTFNAAVKSLG